MNLTIDIGNSFIKIIVFDDTKPVFRKVADGLSVTLIRSILKNYPVDSAMASSVVELDEEENNILKSLPGFAMLSARTELPISNLYKTPQSLGGDRLANAVAAAFLMPGKNVLVIDAGTCVKYDFVNANNEYLGGSISPGLTMRLKALHHFTGKLPLVKDLTIKALTGNDTVSAIQTGVLIGMTEEMKGFIHLYKMKYQGLKVILTGGDSTHFAEKLNLSIFAAADLVNIGLNEIIRSNSLSR